MKHIKLFEDYSEEELRDLQDTLHDIGHKTKFVQGEDFGFGEDFKQDSLYNYPSMTKEMVDSLYANGEIKIVPDRPGNFYFKNPENFGIKPWKKDPTYPKIRPFDTKKGIYFIDHNTDSNKPNAEQISIYNGIMKKLGQIRI
jgi:hypothetical protein